MSLLGRLISSTLLSQDKEEIAAPEEPVKQEKTLVQNSFAKAERVIAAAERDAAQLLELERSEDGEL